MKRSLFHWRPNLNALHAILVTTLGIAAIAVLLRHTAPARQGAVTSIVYSIWIAWALGHALRRRSLAAVGLTTRRLGLGIGLSIPLALILAAGALQDPSMRGATLVIPAGARLAAMIVTIAAAAFAEQLMFAGYLQSSFSESFGHIGGVLAYSILFTAFHVSLLWLPGAVPPSGAGIAQFTVGLLVGSCLVSILYAVTGNVWAMVIAGTLNTLILTLYRLSVRPQEVLVGDPSTLVSGIPLVLGWLLAVWLVARMIVARLPSGLRA